MVFSALSHRLLLRSGPLDAAYGSFVVDLVFTGDAAATDLPSTRSNLD